MLLNGVNHVAILTNDTDRLHAFYGEVFDATGVDRTCATGDGRAAVVHRHRPDHELNVFEIDGNTEADRQTPMFGRGRIDHIGLQAASLEAFDTIRERLIARGVDRRLRHRLRPDPEPLLRRSRRPRGRGVRPEPQREPGVSTRPERPAAGYERVT